MPVTVSVYWRTWGGIAFDSCRGSWSTTGHQVEKHGATYHVQEVLVAGRHDGGWMSEERCFNSVHMTVGIGLGCFMRTVGGELEKLLIAEFAEVWCTGHPISASEIGADCSGGRLAVRSRMI